MAQASGERPSRWKKEDPLQLSLERFARTLAVLAPGKEADWATDVTNALDSLEKALQQHIANAEAPDGLLAEVDLTRPTLVRRVAELRKEHTDFQERIRTLQQEAQRAAQAFQSWAQPPDSSALPEPEPVGGVPDFGALRQQGEELAAALTQHKEAETDITLESVATDIGVGD
jgi:uncharacterized protein YdiU (UPF0061 family)